MKEHKKHGSHPHDKMSAMPQFNEGHWEKKQEDVNVGGSRYASEMNTSAEYKKSVDGLASYVKSHKPQH